MINQILVILSLLLFNLCAIGITDMVPRTIISGNRIINLRDVTTQPSNLNLTGIVAVSEDELWVIGNEMLWRKTPQGEEIPATNSVLLVSQNGGQSWEKRLRFSDTFFSRVYLLKSGDAWILGDNGLALKSQDKGHTWKPQNIPVESLLLDLQFISPYRGWILSLDRKILQTQDGGKTWVAYSFSSEVTFFSISFKDEATGWAVAENGDLYQTRNGGKTWQSRTPEFRKMINLPPGDEDLKFRTIKAVNTREIFCFADVQSKINDDKAVRLRSQDGGITWNIKTISTSTGGLNKVYIVNEKEAWLVPGNRHIKSLLHTSDGWETFKEIKLPVLERPGSFYFLNSQMSWFIIATDDFSSTIIFCTTDGWKTSKKLKVE